MARLPTMAADWDATPCLVEGERISLSGRFSLEVAPDLIVTPLLHGHRRDVRGSGYTHLPLGPLVLHARGEAHLRVLLDEVAPRLRESPHAFVLDADTGTVHRPANPAERLEVDALPELITAAVRGSDPTALRHDATADWFTRSTREKLAALPTRADVEEFYAQPEVRQRIADAAARAEATPMRLWDAMLWRGTNYRWELIGEEVPLVGELWSELAASRTLAQCVTDAERAFGAGATEAAGWIVCGAVRARRLGSRVELRLRVSGADRRAAFLPASGAAGDGEMPSLFGALLPGDGKGKTQLSSDGYADSVMMVAPTQSARATAEHLAGEIRRVVGAEATVAREGGAGRAARRKACAATGAWRVEWYEKFVTVQMPMDRDGWIAWDITKGLHLSDDFVMGDTTEQRSQQESTAEAVGDAAAARANALEAEFARYKAEHAARQRP